MKKTLACALIVLMTVGALHAQNKAEENNGSVKEQESVESIIYWRLPLIENLKLPTSGWGLDIGFRLNPSIPLYLTAGVEYYLADTETEYMGDKTTSHLTSLNVPVTMAYHINLSNTTDWNILVQAGVRYNYLLSVKVGNNSMIDGMDRSSFNGLIRLGVGRGLKIFGEYAFPFGNGNGVWSVGFCASF